MISSHLELTVHRVYTDVFVIFGRCWQGRECSSERTYGGDYASIIVREVGKASVGDMMCALNWCLLGDTDQCCNNSLQVGVCGGNTPPAQIFLIQ